MFTKGFVQTYESHAIFSLQHSRQAIVTRAELSPVIQTRFSVVPVRPDRLTTTPSVGASTLQPNALISAPP